MGVKKGQLALFSFAIIKSVTFNTQGVQPVAMKFFSLEHAYSHQ